MHTHTYHTHTHTHTHTHRYLVRKFDPELLESDTSAMVFKLTNIL